MTRMLCASSADRHHAAKIPKVPNTFVLALNSVFVAHGKIHTSSFSMLQYHKRRKEYALLKRAHCKAERFQEI